MGAANNAGAVENELVHWRWCCGHCRELLRGTPTTGGRLCGPLQELARCTSPPAQEAAVTAGGWCDVIHHWRHRGTESSSNIGRRSSVLLHLVQETARARAFGASPTDVQPVFCCQSTRAHATRQNGNRKISVCSYLEGISRQRLVANRGGLPPRKRFNFTYLKITM